MNVRLYENPLSRAVHRAPADVAAKARALGLRVTAEGKADMILALGGDGTLLRAVHEFPDTPVLGLNFGGLGYLSSVEARDFDRALTRLAEGRYRISPRTMLCARKRGETADAAARQALNDVVIVREMSGHCSRLDLTVDGRMAAHYMADGLVFATPTGSTAYSLSAGGPVLMPDSQSVVVTPMCPHALGVRPLVVKETSLFSVTARARRPGDAETLGVYADGVHLFSLAADETVEIERAARVARLVELDGYDPYAVLAHKLGWSGSCVL